MQAEKLGSGSLAANQSALGSRHIRNSYHNNVLTDHSQLSSPCTLLPQVWLLHLCHWAAVLWLTLSTTKPLVHTFSLTTMMPSWANPHRQRPKKSTASSVHGHHRHLRDFRHRAHEHSASRTPSAWLTIGQVQQRPLNPNDIVPAMRAQCHLRVSLLHHTKYIHKVLPMHLQVAGANDHKKLTACALNEIRAHLKHAASSNLRQPLSLPRLA